MAWITELKKEKKNWFNIEINPCILAWKTIYKKKNPSIAYLNNTP